MLSRRARIFGGLLALIAFVAVSWGGYHLLSRVQTLEAQNEQLRNQTFELKTARSAFTDYFNRFDVRDRLSGLITAEDQAYRTLIVDEVRAQIGDELIDFDTAAIVREALQDLESPSEEQRNAGYNQLYIALFDTVEPVIVPPAVINPDVRAAIDLVTSTIVTFAGAASGIISFVVFFTSGRKRGVEAEMVELDLEMRRVELATARFAAREALEYTPPPFHPLHPNAS